MFISRSKYFQETVRCISRYEGGVGEGETGCRGKEHSSRPVKGEGGWGSHCYREAKDGQSVSNHSDHIKTGMFDFHLKLSTSLKKAPGMW